MNILKIAIVMLVLIMSVGAVCAAENITNTSSDIIKNDIYKAEEDSFTNLTDEIAKNDVVNLDHDYTFKNQNNRYS